MFSRITNICSDNNNNNNDNNNDDDDDDDDDDERCKPCQISTSLL